MSDRIVRRDEVWNPKTFSFVYRDTVPIEPLEEVSDDDGRPILIVRRIFGCSSMTPKVRVKIKNGILLDELREINRDTPGIDLISKTPTVKPEVIFHSRFGINKALLQAQASNDLERYEIFAETMRYINDDFGQTIGSLDYYVDCGYTTYELLEFFIPPNTLVYRYHSSTEQHQVLLARAGSYKESLNARYFELLCDLVTFDGEDFGVAHTTLTIKEFPGAQRIQDLDAYPFQYHLNYQNLYNDLINRGRKFAAMTQYTYGQILPGPALRGARYGGGEKFHVSGRAVIDPVAFRMFQPNCSFNHRVDRVLSRTELTDAQLLICNPVVYGFSLSSKIWGGFAIDRLTEIDWSRDAFELLVLGEKQKKMIRAIVKQHSKRDSFDDIIAGKGKGLICLFCGRPGCGKTLTAEAVADLYQVPLYVVTAGELGIEPDSVDKRLTDIFQVAKMWNAVVLIDEAEVFLQQRSPSDVKRNALVTIFLRQLEYYQGILILTTNLLDQCDAALESRIHLSIHYPDLDFDSRKQIWKTFLKKVSDLEQFGEDIIDGLASHTMNGRQIKNTVSSAQCIAMDENEPLSMRHIETVMEVVSDWNSARQKLAEPGPSHTSSGERNGEADSAFGQDEQPISKRRRV